ncbi:TPA: hypothetical protein ANIA_11433 [Aspergillus nidulans FGSC A4]|uniref:Uncharacterized protein n=1 Tax=Emericella nidulans (strain FGSC A4 / ATCC 38163 / CBS 112.46 / NRRL 194 / M139) TaxID=227321 RepID=C8V9A4_EMENI|nr:TPA: hypothetical protein ANIA_11433 [Aspergillus nidulans FGSC A4]
MLKVVRLYILNKQDINNKTLD